MSITRRVDQLRKNLAEEYRQANLDNAPEEHNRTHHKYIGDFVYGALDGIITTFAVVSGVAGAELRPGIVIILGLANLFADGFSMAMGAYLSCKSEREYYERERRRESWEVENFPKGERRELVEIYIDKGYSESDAQQLVSIHERHQDRFVDEMMVHELGMLQSDREPWLSGVATLISFLVAGSVPMLVYLLGLFLPIPAEHCFRISILLTVIGLFGLGAAKVKVTAQHWLRSGVEMLLLGGLAALVAYGVGFILKGLA